MSMVSVPASALKTSLMLGVLVLAAGVACLMILWPFMAAILWALILAYTSWPLYARLKRPFGRFRTLAAATMTALLSGAVVLPVLWVGLLAADETAVVYHQLMQYLAAPSHPLPAFVRSLPWVGEMLQQHLDRFAAEPPALKDQIIKWAQAWSSELAAMASGLGRNVGKLVTTMITLFFFYRDGDSLVRQAGRVVTRFFGTRLNPYLFTAAAMTRAVVYGLVVTAFAQGLVAGIGYAILGIEGAALLGALTGILSLLPVVGTLIVWGSLGTSLLVSGHVLKGILLLLWGSVLVHPTDNVLRPLLISNATQVPFLIVMFGVVGGVSTLGLVGAFVGPVLLAVALSLWREWAGPSGDPSPPVVPG
jgi:predicted PurR-regulated permease PerM